MMSARSRSLAALHDFGGADALTAHAHVEWTIESKGEAALGIVQLHRRDAEIEDHAVDRLVSGIARD